ncbi:MAG: hypothetical protein ACOX41_02235 [Anaerovoracaceae bacterium]
MDEKTDVKKQERNRPVPGDAAAETTQKAAAASPSGDAEQPPEERRALLQQAAAAWLDEYRDAGGRDTPAAAALRETGLAQLERLVPLAQRELRDRRRLSPDMARLVTASWHMGRTARLTGSFDASRVTHSYRMTLEDGSVVSYAAFFRTFMTASQTGAYTRAENILLLAAPSRSEEIYHLVRDRRRGINSVFKAVFSVREPQRIGLPDYVLSITCTCAGLLGDLFADAGA